MLPTCRSNTPIPPCWEIRILFAALDAVMLQQVCISAAFYLTQVLIGTIVHIWNYLIILTTWTKSGTKSNQDLVTWYKQLQIITILGNTCNQKRIFPAAAIGLPSIEFFTFFVCVKLHDSLTGIEVAFFFLIFLNVVAFNMTVFLAASKVFSCSEGVLQMWRREWKSARKSEMRRVLRALEPLKIKFNLNFVENNTPLVIQDVCSRQTIGSLLIVG